MSAIVLRRYQPVLLKMAAKLEQSQNFKLWTKGLSPVPQRLPERSGGWKWGGQLRRLCIIPQLTPLHSPPPTRRE